MSITSQTKSIRNTIAQLAKAYGPSPGDVYRSQTLTDMTVGFMLTSEGYAHNELFPRVQVAEQKGEYPVFKRGSMFRPAMEKRAPGARSPGGGFDVTFQDFKADVWAWHLKLPKQTAVNGARLGLDRAASIMCANQAILNREVRFLEAYFKTGVWTTNVTGSATPSGDNQTLTWLDEDSNPITFLRALVSRGKKLGAGNAYRFNRLLISEDLWLVLMAHPKIMALIDSGQTPGGAAMFTQEALARLIGVEKVIVADAVYNTSKPGQTTETMDFIAPSGSLLLVHAAPNMAEGIATAGVQIEWTGYTGAGENGAVMSSWWDQPEASMYYEVEQAFTYEVVAADLGIFVSGLLTTPA